MFLQENYWLFKKIPAPSLLVCFYRAVIFEKSDMFWGQPEIMSSLASSWLAKF